MYGPFGCCMAYALCDYHVPMTVVPMPSSRAGTLTARFVAEIRAEMGRQQVSGSELARRCGVPQPYVSRRLTLKTPMDIDDMELFAHALGKPVSAVMAEAEALAREADTPVNGVDFSRDKGLNHGLTRTSTPASAQARAGQRWGVSPVALILSPDRVNRRAAS